MQWSHFSIGDLLKTCSQQAQSTVGEKVRHYFKQGGGCHKAKIKHLCFFSKHEKLAIFYTGTNLNCSLALDRLSSEGTACFTTVYGEKGKPKGAKERSIVGTQWTEVSIWRKVSVSGVRTPRSQEAACSWGKQYWHVAVKRLFCNQHNSDAMNRRWQGPGTEHRSTSWL